MESPLPVAEDRRIRLYESRFDYLPEFDRGARALGHEITVNDNIVGSDDDPPPPSLLERSIPDRSYLM